MNYKEFLEFSKDKVILICTEINNKTSSFKPKTFDLHWFFTFNIDEITISKKKIKSRETVMNIKYQDIQKVIVEAIEKPAIVISAVETRVRMRLKFILNNETSMEFEDSDLTLLPEVIELLNNNNIPVEDNLNLKNIVEMNKNEDSYKIYQEVHNLLDNLSKDTKESALRVGIGRKQIEK